MFKLVINGMRKEDLRLGCMAVARDYIRDVNPAFFRDDTELFNNQIQTLVANVLPKKKPVLEVLVSYELVGPDDDRVTVRGGYHDRHPSGSWKKAYALSRQ